MNHTRFPEEDHLPDWARRDNKVTKGDRVEGVWFSDSSLWSLQGFHHHISNSEAVMPANLILQEGKWQLHPNGTAYSVSWILGV